MNFGWKSNINKSYDHGHWNTVLAAQPEKNGRVDVSRINPLFTSKNFISDSWREIQEVIGKRNLVRCYINGYTYGTDSYAHYDEHALYKEYSEFLGASETILIYLNDEWHHDYGGETVFFDENNEIKLSVLPKLGRTVVFNSDILHAARPVTRMYGGLREVLVFKTSKYTEDGKEDLFQMLFKKYSGVQHSGGTLFEHLVGTYKLLKEIGCANDICLAGLLHSCMGTESFQPDYHFTKEQIIEYTNEQVYSFVERFGKTKNRIETFSKYNDHTMLLIEWANLKDQASREPNRYLPSFVIVDNKLKGMR